MFLKLTTSFSFHKHFTHVTYNQSKLRWCISKMLCGSMHTMDGTAYFAKAFSNNHKMFMELTICVIFHKHFTQVTYSCIKLS
jgi:hypothetical protein